MPDPLDIPPTHLTEMGEAVLEHVAAYYATLRNRPILIPTTSQALRALLDEPLPQHPSTFDAILDQFDQTVLRYTRHNAHPRMFGYVASPGTPITALAAMLQSAVNVNATAWRSGPAAAELEHVTINWLKEMLDYPKTAAGLFVSGGSLANFAALAAARSAKAPGNVVRDGLSGAPPMCLYVSEEAHFSIAKAAGMLGLGEANVRHVKTNDRFQLDPVHLETLIEADRASGRLPVCVVASAGTTATGAVDPIAEIAEIARRHDLWLHVDAAYGGPAALVPSVRPLFAGIEQADSIALDPHKWLYLPMGCGCVLYRDPARARAAFAHGAEYTRTIGLEHDEAFAFWDYGPELSRPFRALELWFLMKFAGARRIAEAIERNIACALYLERLVNASPDFEMLAPVELSIFCFRYKNAKGDLDALNEQILIALQKAGSSYLSNANLRGKFALRGCVLNYRTTEADMDRLLADVRAAAQSLLR